MTPIIETIEVDRPPEEVFSYVTDPSRFGEWQKGVVGGHMEGNGQTGVGSKCITTRRIGLAERPVTAEVTAINPPRNWAVHGIDGPIRATVNVNVDPLDEGTRSRVTITLDFEGRGIGKLLVPLVVHREAEKEMPANLRQLKQRLESDA
jgi:carbon monoxide dehydrogenase subunit G